MEKIKLGISTCLLGENVRFDGGHKLDRYLTDTLGQFVEYVPVCPEMECGASPRCQDKKTGCIWCIVIACSSCCFIRSLTYSS